MSAPLYDKLIGYHLKNRISFAMPGHKNGRGLKPDLLCCDVTELRGTENLHHPRAFIKESKRLLSGLFYSDESFIVTGGSTTCIQAMIAASVRRGGMLLAAADCHMSVINACALLGIKIRLIPRVTDGEFLIAGRLFDIEKYIEGADAVIVTSPTYYGLCADIEKIAEQCHKHGIPLLVDEAHGAHFIADGRFPRPAVTLGADAVCQSAHKTLDALTGAAFLHVKGRLIDSARIAQAITMLETSSPSYVIAASADLAREKLGRGGWSGIINECDALRLRLESETEIRFLKNDDPTRLVINFGAYETTGFAVDELLSEKFNIDVEMSDLVNIVLIVTPSNTAEDLETLCCALIKIANGLEKRKNPLSFTFRFAPGGVISPSDVLFLQTETVPLLKSAGRVSAAAVTPYPPGIPVIYQGGRITEEQLEYINELSAAGAEIIGLKDGNIEILKQEENI